MRQAVFDSWTYGRPLGCDGCPTIAGWVAAGIAVLAALVFALAMLGIRRS